MSWAHHASFDGEEQPFAGTQSRAPASDWHDQLADQGDGFYAYVDTFAEARRLFGRDLTSTLTPVAREARTRSTQE